mgnify:FL=1
MRLYRFVKTDDKIDVVVATDGSCGQKRVFITESPRGVVVPGQTGAIDDQKEGSDAFLALGWKWNVGETVQHEDLVDFAEENGLTLTIEPQEINDIVTASAEWDAENNLVVTAVSELNQSKEVEAVFPNIVNLAESATRFGEITNGGHSIKGKILNSWTFTLADLGLDAKEELEIVLFANGGVQSFNLVASAD